MWLLSATISFLLDYLTIDKEAVMFWRRPLIRIDNVDNIDIDTPFHPLFYRLIRDLIKSSSDRGESPSNRQDTFKGIDIPPRKDQVSYWINTLDLVGKFATILSGVAILVFVILLFSGRTTLGHISVGTLLTVVSFTLIGGLISIGGVHLFSFNASLRKARDQVDRYIHSVGGCPFVYVIDNEARTAYDIGGPFKIVNPDFCRGCRLVDQGGRTTCRFSPLYRD
jgi:hypothetical protein